MHAKSSGGMGGQGMHFVCCNCGVQDCVFKSCEFKKKEAYRDKKKGRQDRDRINEAWLISTLEEGALERTEHYI